MLKEIKKVFDWALSMDCDPLLSILAFCWIISILGVIIYYATMLTISTGYYIHWVGLGTIIPWGVIYYFYTRKD